MKKIAAGIGIFFTPFLLQAQDRFSVGNGSSIPAEYVRIFSSILVLYLVINFILGILKSVLDSRLKSKMVDKGVSDRVVEQFLQPNNRDAGTVAIKSFLILTGLGVGLTIIYFTLPIGIHSFAIMAFSIALSFLAYYFFVKKPGNTIS